MPYFTSQSKLGGLCKKRKTNITQKISFAIGHQKRLDVRLTHQGHHQGKNVYAAIDETSNNPKYLPLLLAFLATIPNRYFSEHKRHHLLHNCIHTSFFSFFNSKNRKVELYCIGDVRSWLELTIIYWLYSVETRILRVVW